MNITIAQLKTFIGKLLTKLEWDFNLNKIVEWLTSGDFNIDVNGISATSVNVSGTLTAGAYSGDGSGLTNLSSALGGGLYSNCLINSAMDVWQRGTSSVDPATDAFLADRWKIINTNGGGTAPVATWSQEATTIPSNNRAKYALEINVTNVGVANATTEYGFKQIVEDWDRFKGKTISITAQMQAPAVNDIVDILVDDGVQTTLIDRQTLTTAYAEYKYENIAISNSATQLEIIFRIAGGTGLSIPSSANFIPSATGKFYFTQIACNLGDTADNFNPRLPSDELNMCRRYYYRLHGGSSSHWLGGVTGSRNSDNVLYLGITLPVALAKEPTVTLGPSAGGGLSFKSYNDAVSGGINATTSTITDTIYASSTFGSFPNYLTLEVTYVGAFTTAGVYYFTTSLGVAVEIDAES